MDNGDKSRQAFAMASAAAEMDFSAAIQGLIAGHSAKLDKLEKRLGEKDIALLASLALSKKGARIGADRGLADAVLRGIRTGPTASNTEKEFQALHSET